MVHIRIADPDALAMNGQYLVEYDPSRDGVSPEGYPMFAHIVVSPDPAAARLFADFDEAVAYWRTPHGLRDDGQPNRPLTAFSIEVEAHSETKHQEDQTDAQDSIRKGQGTAVAAHAEDHDSERRGTGTDPH